MVMVMKMMIILWYDYDLMISYYIIELEVKKKEEILTKQAIDVLREKERKYQEQLR